MRNKKKRNEKTLVITKSDTFPVMAAFKCHIGKGFPL